MEFILINESRLKIILSKEDLEVYEALAEELDYTNTETKRIFWDILGRAKKSVGFCCDGVRILVKLFTCPDGGCEIFVSKLGIMSNDGSSGLSFYSPDRGAAGDFEAVYSFENAEWLIAVCRRLYAIDYAGKSSVYIGDDRRFYLFLCDSALSSYMPIDEYTFICEYGTREGVEATRHYLAEHGREICGSDAVRRLAPL